MLFNSIVHVACTTKVEKCEKNERETLKLNTYFNFYWVFRYVNKYVFVKTHKLNRLMKDGTFFQPCAFHITKK